MIRRFHRCNRILIFVGLLALLGTVHSSDATAAWGESYLSFGAGYVPVSTADRMLHTGSLVLGGGYHLSDFALVAGDIIYGATYSGSRAHQIMGADAIFRLLLDATQWVPSVGPSVGWLGHYDHEDGFDQGFNLGLSVCVDYRPWRDRSVGVCGQLAIFPFADSLQGLYLISANFNAFLPWFFK